jgi:hypothetical protein
LIFVSNTILLIVLFFVQKNKKKIPFRQVTAIQSDKGASQENMKAPLSFVLSGREKGTGLLAADFTPALG